MKDCSRTAKFAVGFLVCLIIGGIYTVYPLETNIKSATFARLESIRNEKKQQLIDYFNNIRKTAGAIQDDQFMQTSFRRLISQKDGDQALEFSIDRHFVIHYGDFYDILFVDSAGYVFHSIRKESDYQTDLFTGEVAGTKLVKNLKQHPENSFVEYEFYPPSGEPVAFFAVPVMGSGRHDGWFVLQCSVNQVNTLLTSRDGLGRTGEVYLVNQGRLMLSDSRFIEDSTILKHQVNTQAVRDAMRSSMGQQLIEDYRGIRVFSSYEKFNLFNTSWIIISEIDESEIITDYYRSDPDRLKAYMSRSQRVIGKNAPLKKPAPGNVRRIDMNEYAKTTGDTVLTSYGVSTCTAVAIVLPKKFAYVAHISPRDIIYRRDRWHRIFDTDPERDFLGELIRRVKHYDVYPYELKQLQFVIIAPHTNGFDNAVEKILNAGVDLSNITFMQDPSAQGANISVDADDGTVSVQWYAGDKYHWTSNLETESLESIYKKAIGYDS